MSHAVFALVGAVAVPIEFETDELLPEELEDPAALSAFPAAACCSASVQTPTWFMSTRWSPAMQLFT